MSALIEHRETTTLPATNVTRTDGAALMEVISRAASDPSTDVGKLERLMAMLERITARQAHAAYVAAMAAMQPELPVIDQRGRIEVRAKDNQGGRTGAVQQSTSYATWEDINDAIKPFLQKHGFALTFRTGMSEDGRVKVTGVLSHREGHSDETTMVLPHDSTGSKNAVQAIGSSTSYGKRYTAMALLNLTSRAREERDDDGQAAERPPTINDEEIGSLVELLDSTGSDRARFLAFFKADNLRDIPAARYGEAIHMLQQKASRR